MKKLLMYFITGSVAAMGQTPPDQQRPAQQAAAPQQQQQAAPAAAVAQQSPAPAPGGEAWLTGWIDLGYRWRTDVAGSIEAYRSFINFGSGPKLLGTEFTIADPKRRFFDHIHARAYSWGDDPSQTLHLDARKEKLYNFNADYRDFTLFDNLSSYADPLPARGIVLNEQSFDTRRRIGSFQLDFLPGNWISPYLAYDFDYGSGNGVTAFVSSGNQFPVPTHLLDGTNNFRGGVNLQLRRFHVTVEQGGTTFHDDQNVFQNGSVNYGNVLTPVFGQQTYLNNLVGAYGIRGNSIYSKGLLSARAASWLDIYGQFLYSKPDTNVNYQQYASGNQLLQSQILFYTGQQYLVTSAANMPHTTGNFGAEIRPFRRLRITEAWLTDRLHNAGSAFQNQTLTTNGGGTIPLSDLLASSLVTNYNQAEIDLFFDLTTRLTLRGGYRYVWGSANDAALPPEGLASADQVRLRRNVGLGGATFHATRNLTLSGEAEGASSGAAYFRNSLYDYQRVRARASYQASTSLSFSGDFSLLNNSNPYGGANYSYLAYQESLSVFWSPAGEKPFSFLGTYSRADLASNINYLDPGTLQPRLSRYTDNSHTVTALFRATLPHLRGPAPQIEAGGSFLLSSGSRPTSVFQPNAKVWVPIDKHVSLFAQWQYYGYGEPFYLQEGFRTHLVTAGLRYTR
jgi:hypothetical protein